MTTFLFVITLTQARYRRVNVFEDQENQSSFFHVTLLIVSTHVHCKGNIMQEVASERFVNKWVYSVGRKSLA